MLRRLCLRLSMTTYTGFDYYMNLPVFEILEICKDLKEIRKEDERKAGKK